MPKTFGIALLALVLAAASPTPAVAQTAASPTPAVAKASAQSDQIPGRYIVTLKDTAAPDGAEMNEAVDTAVEQASTLGARVQHVYRYALHGYSASMSPSVAATLADDPRVRSVEPDRLVHATAQSIPTGVDRAEADKSPTAAIDGVDTRVNADVAVIDTGIAPNHPDLNVYRAGGKNCWLSLLPPSDLHGHGTHVAGTIGALDNGTGVVGTAPGVRLWPVQVLSPLGSGSTSNVICGIDHVTEHADEIDVANMSLGGSGTDDGNCGKTNNDAMHQAICNSVAQGVTYAVAAGNDHSNAANMVPAAYDEVITVSALADFDGKPGGLGGATCRSDVDDTFANFSNYGPDVDLIAPGVCIRSTSSSGGYTTMSGTSMAAPHVAGGAALYRATHPGASPQTVKAALQAAGSFDWTWPSQDGDGTKERLLRLTSF
ncbi:S8 family serine peptidase [Streptomyces lunaelactis]|uniref:S8 family serine peptidase n=1 Tax=Streptomyces lunaelactis TaxID=1535768 RepID=UPI001585B67C|nr:S8 family serine peptidase [Streptomyces lunaelactis]NUK10386.1 S8 family serine peptidase [Streptomyces lunaelactis]NUK55358.1 S8 family serine peptidase [Streptomyces lunaelactis]NUK66991.1 S8 family serine peptidase [Streptomyces lunaelactis]NUL14161.1 S8 family serine peptidase [Streptomyces lunaelactis]NUL25770.1 S8 family serine peptidase [Streptomyces lunaelactis]